MAAQDYLWKIVDYLKIQRPGLFKLSKVIFKPLYKFLIFWLIALRQSRNDYRLNNRKAPRRSNKISFIVVNCKKNSILQIEKRFKIPFKAREVCKELIYVSSRDKSNTNLSKKTNIVKSLAKAVEIATGDYICFLEDHERFNRFGFNKLYKIISQTNYDAYFSNYVDHNGTLIKTCDSRLLGNFSKEALPVATAFGLKIISKELAAKVRLPKGTIYSYILEASDKIESSKLIEYPIIINGLGDKETKRRSLTYQSEQEKALRRRYFYSNIEPVRGINKVLFIAPWLVIGGAEKVLLDLSSEFIKRNIQVDIFCTHKAGEWESEFKKAGAKIYLSKKQNLAEKINEIDKLVRKNRYDVIHTSNTEYGYHYSLKVKELPYRPVFIDTIHSQNNPLVDYAKYYQTYIDAFVTVNDYIKESLGGSIRLEKMHPVHNGVNTIKYKKIDTKLRYDNQKITYIGRVSEEKNPLQFIKIAKKLSKKHPLWKYEVVGDGPMLDEMKNFVKRSGLSAKFSFLGYVSDGASKITDSSCCVITSHTEGLPIVLLEALSLGVPVVSSNVGGIHEALLDGSNGYLVGGPNDTESYVKSIEKVMSSYAKYKKLSLSATESMAEYTSVKMAKKVIDVYNQSIKLINKKFDKITTIAMLSFNRADAIERTLKTIYENTEVPFNLLVLDNGSEKETVNFLKKFASKHDNFKVIFEKKNLGCPGGRHKMLQTINSDYIVTIDNDMEVPKFWLRDLIIRMEEDSKIMGVCTKCIFPNHTIQFTGGSISTDKNGFYLFNANDYGKQSSDLSTLKEYDCDWLPGGATLWRGNISQIAQHSLEYINAFEDFDYALQIIKQGYRTVNCPYVALIHHHSGGLSEKQQTKEAKYISDRNNKDGFILSLAAFYRRTGYIMRNDMIYNLFNIPTSATPEEVEKLVEKIASKTKRP